MKTASKKKASRIAQTAKRSARPQAKKQVKAVRKVKAKAVPKKKPVPKGKPAGNVNKARATARKGFRELIAEQGREIKKAKGKR